MAATKRELAAMQRAIDGYTGEYVQERVDSIRRLRHNHGDADGGLAKDLILWLAVASVKGIEVRPTEGVPAGHTEAEEVTA